jgi:hypothetical protein
MRNFLFGALAVLGACVTMPPPAIPVPVPPPPPACACSRADDAVALAKGNRDALDEVNAAGDIVDFPDDPILAPGDSSTSDADADEHDSCDHDADDDHDDD